jgi:integrase
MLSQQLDYERGIREYLEQAFRTKFPVLIDFSLRNQTVLKLIRHLKRHTTGSPHTAYQYVYGIWRFSKWINSEPDKILFECWGPEGDPLPKMLVKHAQLLDDFMGHLQDQNSLAPGTRANYLKGTKALYAANKLRLDVPRYPRTVVYPDRSPSPEELQRVLAVADLRGKLIIALLALGGFRASTLSKLEYRHVKHDLETNTAPLLVRVEPGILKGKGWDTQGHWTFLPEEAISLIRLYLAERQRGNRFFPPETIRENSPLIRNVGSAAGKVLPVSPGEIWHIVNTLYVKAGIIARCANWRNHRRRGPDCEQCGYPNLTKTRHELCVHSCRYYFRTRLTALGINREYVEFWFGHKNKLYNDVKSTGEEFHRSLYQKADFTITPKPQASRLDLLKQLVTSFGYNPDEVLRREGFSEPHRVMVGFESPDDSDEARLTKVLRRAVLQEAHTVDNSFTADRYKPSVSSNLPRATNSSRSNMPFPSAG